MPGPPSVTVIAALLGCGAQAPTVAGSALPDHALLSLPPVFASHMVLPAGALVTIRGTAEQGTGPVTVVVIPESSEDDELATAKGDEVDGTWSVTLPAMDSSSEPVSISITSAKAQITLEDVLIGDVYVCVGASNMGFPVSSLDEDDRSEALGLASELGDDLRIMRVERSRIPRDNFAAEVPWQRAEPLESGPTASFSALCYYFGAAALKARPTTPVGLVQVTVGDSRSWHWAHPGSFEKCAVDAPDGGEVSIYWDSMLNPLFALRGVRAILNDLEVHSTCVSVDSMSQMQQHWRAEGSEDSVPAAVWAPYSCLPEHSSSAGADWSLEQGEGLDLPRSGVVVTSDLCAPVPQGCGSYSPYKREEARRFLLRADQLLGRSEAGSPRPLHVLLDVYDGSWGAFHFGGGLGGGACRTCNWGIRVVFDREVELRPEFREIAGRVGLAHINGFLLHVNEKPGTNYSPMELQMNGVSGDTVQLNVTIGYAGFTALGVDTPWPGRLEYGGQRFPIMPIVGSGTGEPAPHFTVDVPFGDGAKNGLPKSEFAP